MIRNRGKHLIEVGKILKEIMDCQRKEAMKNKLDSIYKWKAIF